MAQGKRRKKPSQPSKLIDMHIDAIGARGDGVAAHEGGHVYVPYTAPGDFATVRVKGERGVLEALITPGSRRAEAPCAHFGACGGCGLQHLDGDYYRAWKWDLVAAALRRENFDESIINPLIVCPAASRRRATFAVVKTGAGLIFGFHQRRANKIEEVVSCKILHPRLAKKLGALKALGAAVPAKTFSLGVTLCDNGLDINIICDQLDFLSANDVSALTARMDAAACVRLSVNGEVMMELAKPSVIFSDVTAALPPNGFLQASKEGEAALTALVMESAQGARRIIDLFSGCGTFTLPLASVAAVDAFDSDRPSIAALDAAARMAKLAHPVKATVQNLFDRPMMAAELNAYDVAVFDPPRAGARAQAEQIAAAETPVVIGVSCNPATFARDAAILRDGGYRLTQATPVDQFVYAHHIELVGVFRRN